MLKPLALPREIAQWEPSPSSPSRPRPRPLPSLGAAEPWAAPAAPAAAPRSPPAAAGRRRGVSGAGGWVGGRAGCSSCPVGAGENLKGSRLLGVHTAGSRQPLRFSVTSCKDSIISCECNVSPFYFFPNKVWEPLLQQLAGNNLELSKTCIPKQCYGKTSLFNLLRFFPLSCSSKYLPAAIFRLRHPSFPPAIYSLFLVLECYSLL